MDSHVGSGKIITAPIITEDGEPIHEPLVLMEATPDQAASNKLVDCHGSDASREKTTSNVPMDKKIIDWKLTLHQIGRYKLDVFHFLFSPSMCFSLYEDKVNPILVFFFYLFIC